MTWRRNWKEDLYATFQNSHRTFHLSSGLHGGYLYFGFTPVGNGLTLIWLLKNKTFRAQAIQFHGRSIGFVTANMLSQISQIALTEYSAVGNFVPKIHPPNMRLLRTAGFSVYQDPFQLFPCYFCVTGMFNKRLLGIKNFWEEFLGPVEQRTL